MRIYLAGPMTGHTYDEAMGWRHAAIRALEKDNVLLSPLRGYTREQYEEEFGGAKTDGGSKICEYRRDKWDCSICDVLLVNLSYAKRVSIGTMFEIAWASMRPDCLVVTIMDETNPNWHLMPKEASDFVVPNLAEAIRQVCLAGVQG